MPSICWHVQLLHTFILPIFFLLRYNHDLVPSQFQTLDSCYNNKTKLYCSSILQNLFTFLFVRFQIDWFFILFYFILENKTGGLSIYLFNQSLVLISEGSNSRWKALFTHIQDSGTTITKKTQRYKNLDLDKILKTNKEITNEIKYSQIRSKIKEKFHTKYLANNPKSKEFTL